MSQVLQSGPLARLPFTLCGPAERELPALGRWQPIRLLGEGATAQVFLAHPATAGAEAARYALKVLKDNWAHNERAIEQIRREALVGSSLSHPHLISILDWGVQQPPYYVVMPHLRGATLAARLEANRRPPLPVALWIARQVSEAMAALHDAGWRHADIKPANIFLAADGHVTLLDLGLARRASETGNISERAIVGTPSYLAPEMLTSTLAADVRSDIYSLGVTLYETLAGRLPYAAASLGELAQLQQKTEPPRLRRFVPDLPLAVSTLVHDMLAREPLRRPQSPTELIQRLIALEIATFAERVTA